jgi:threonine dehydratase
MSGMFERILAARERLRGHANATPVLTSRTLNERVGAEVFLKCENFQRVGAFKFRGAFNAISLLPPEQRRRGVIAYSSGNHAQAVALVSRLLGVPATIVMPSDAPSTKRAATEGYGARVIAYDPKTQSRETVAAEIREREGQMLVPPYDYADVVAGQGTAAAELIEATGPLDFLLTPCGGGGLLSGSAVAARAMSAGCRTIGVEPALADDATRSFRTRTLQTCAYSETICDGARTPSLGEVTFPLVLENVADMATVPDSDVIEAVRFLFHRMKLVVEPTGALPVAALLSGAVKASGRVGVVISGGNVDGETMRRILAG